MFRYADSSVLYWLRVAMNQPPDATPSPTQLYAALELYYLNNGVYDAVQQASYESGLWTESMKGLRNPSFRTVEFYTSKICPGQLPDALPIVTENKKIIEPIHTIWEWSNWSTAKQRAVRWFAMFGDLFIKTSTRSNPDGSAKRVYLQLIKPYYVTDIKTDERGFLTYIRIDIPRSKTENGKTSNYIYTEIWSKDNQFLTIYEHTKSIDTPESRLGTPKQKTPFSEFEIDFVPIVQAQFRDIGDDRGLGSFSHALDKIDEANRMATRLHQLLFRYNKPVWALSANALDSSGRPLPAPRVGDSTGTQDSDTLTLGDDALLRLPGTSKLESLIPSIEFSAYSEAIINHLSELEKDLPELAYYRLRDHSGELSGKAVRLLLSDAIDRAFEARGNFESALARADSMALTIAQNAGLFSNLGDYENGDFDHKFAARDIIPISNAEKYETAKTAVDSGIPLKTALRREGWSDDDLKQLDEDQEEESKKNQETFAQTALEAARRFDQGNNPPQNARTDAQDQESQDDAQDQNQK